MPMLFVLKDREFSVWVLMILPVIEVFHFLLDFFSYYYRLDHHGSQETGMLRTINQFLPYHSLCCVPQRDKSVFDCCRMDCFFVEKVTVEITTKSRMIMMMLLPTTSSMMMIVERFLLLLSTVV